MSLLVTGSIGIDSVTTPFGEVRDVLGGSVVYFSRAAAFHSAVRLVGVVGDDFPPEFRDLLEGRNIDTTGLEVRKGSKTFRWSGSYSGDMNEATTTNVELNVLAEAGPKIPAEYADSKFVFLAATHPDLQSDLVSQIENPTLIVADTRDLWIETEHDALLRTLGHVHGAIMNDGEARLLTKETNLILAGRAILKFGPRFVVIKKGEHGAMLVTGDEVAVLPAYPTAEVRDPTGAGDSFAGGMMGYLAARNSIATADLKRALAHGTIAASFTIERFGLEGIRGAKPADLDRRYRDYAAMLRLD